MAERSTPWSLGGALRGLFAAKTIDDDTWTDLEDALIKADFGPDTSDSIVEELRASVAKFKTTDPKDLQRMLRENIENRLAKVPSTHPARQRFLDRVNFYGQVGELDPQGRVLIQPRLREAAQMTGEVDVLGQQSYLEVWNHERLVAKLSAEPFTDDDAKVLCDFGI